MTEDEEARTLRSVGVRLLPVLFIAALLCYLDRANLSFAAIDMNADLNFTDGTYGTGSGIFFAGYACAGIPASFLVKRIGPRHGLGLILMAWGLTSGLQSLIMNDVGFYVVRFFLGASEAGFFPSVIYYLSQWYSETEMGFAYTLVVAATAVSGVLGGPLAGGLMTALHGQAGIAGWRWLFVIEGIPSVLLGLLVFLLLPATPRHAKFLQVHQQEWLVARNETAVAARLARTGGASIKSTLLNLALVVCDRGHSIGAVGVTGVSAATCNAQTC
eukprot:TRINITY_DN11564_c0_g1_i3.p1 TRINITY_DN11564_c0_g1~~TRINITY_DN11564_c0_g1_i3.p1  ORF type:complete len:284 (-),score=53.28 TRINITY_DN11564_c0_g1_i3:62-880(-)